MSWGALRIQSLRGASLASTANIFSVAPEGSMTHGRPPTIRISEGQHIDRARGVGVDLKVLEGHVHGAGPATGHSHVIRAAGDGRPSLLLTEITGQEASTAVRALEAPC